MITNRSVALSIVFSIITCGLYGIYWFYTITEDVSKLSGDRDFVGLKHLLLTLVTCGIWSYIWAYQLGKHLEVVHYQRKQYSQDHSVLYLVLMLFGMGIITYALAQSEINKYAHAPHHY